jgi:hypothetical protein
MANYVGYCITPRVCSEHIAKVTAPSGGLKPGQLVFVEELDSNIAGNYEVFVATQPATAGLGSKHLAMVINGGFETLADGRRPAGQPDYTQYTYAEGENVPVVFLDPHLTFLVSVDSVSGGTSAAPASDIGKFIIPANGTYTGAVDASNSGVGNSLKIVGTYYLPLGGNYGGNFANVYVAVAQ